MKKERRYFSHDLNARSDPKLEEVLMDLGCEGVGMYWCIIEQLYEENGYLPMKMLKTISFRLHVKYDKVLALIDNYELFEHDDDKFWSPSALRRMKQRDEQASKRHIASVKANNKRWQRDDEDVSVLSESDDDVIRNGYQSDDDDIESGEQAESDCLPMKLNKIKLNKKESNREKTHAPQNVLKRFFRKDNRVMLEKMCMDYHTDMDTLKGLAEQIVNEWELTEQTHKDYSDASQHLINLIRIKLNGKYNDISAEADSREGRTAAAMRVIGRMQTDEAARDPFAAAAEV